MPTHLNLKRLPCRNGDSNPKSEFRNSKQYLNFNIKWPKHSSHLSNVCGASTCFEFWISIILICFGLPWRDMIGISYCCDNDSKSDLQKYIHASQVWARDFVLRASNLQNIDQPNKLQQFRRLSAWMTWPCSSHWEPWWHACDWGCADNRTLFNC